MEQRQIFQTQQPLQNISNSKLNIFSNNTSQSSNNLFNNNNQTGGLF
jgi:hypothetical protein